MRQIINIFALSLLFIVASCSENETPIDPAGREAMIIGIVTSGIDYSPLPQSTAKSSTAEDLMAVQIYEVVDGGNLNPYAKGLFRDWNSLTFKGYSDAIYKIEATMIVDASLRLQIAEEVYGKPFDISITEEEFIYSEDPLSGLSTSTATLADGIDYTVPNIDRYYGDNSKKVTLADAKITIAMKRVSFGVKLEGFEGEAITLKLEGAPEVTVTSDESVYFSMQNILTAYNSDESNNPYSETINTEILSDGISVYKNDVDFKRNKLAVVTLEEGDISIGFDFEVPFEEDDNTSYDDIITPDGATAYITKVLDYMPAPGQFTNKLPKYDDGDTQEIMNQKVLNTIGNNNKGMITLGGYGGYVVVGFDHTIVNQPNKRDFRVSGNSFYSAANPDSGAPDGGSCEPGIIMVAYDANKNGAPDDDEWYEIAGSSHDDVTLEPWYQKATDNGNDVNFYFNDFELTYTKPENLTPAAGTDEFVNYIPWRDNKDGEGFIPKNAYHAQSWFPGWVTTNEITFRGSRLPQNGIDESGQGSYFVLYKFRYGYADNETNTKDESAIDISWAVNSEGQRINLPGVDFIKVYCGVNQSNGWLGECSTEITSVEDLHILEINIPTR